MLKSQFPKFNLEDKVAVEEGSVDRDSNNLQLPGQLIHHVTSGPKIWRVYSRRGKKVKSGWGCYQSWGGRDEGAALFPQYKEQSVREKGHSGL